jgi:type I restriction enzyme M protein
MNLTSTIKTIQDIMRKDDGVDGDAQRIGQLTWMLFLKVFDQREEEWEDDKPKYKSPLPTRMRWRNWAAYVPGPDGKKKPQIAPSDVIGFVNNELFPVLNSRREFESTSQGDPQRIRRREQLHEVRNAAPRCYRGT